MWTNRETIGQIYGGMALTMLEPFCWRIHLYNFYFSGIQLIISHSHCQCTIFRNAEKIRVHNYSIKTV